MAEEELASLSQLRRGSVRLAAFPSASATLVPRAVARLERRSPDVDVALTEAEPPEAAELLRTGAVDLALVFGYGAEPVPDEQHLRWSPLAEERVRLVLPPGHPLAGRPAVRLADLAGDTWVAGCVRCREHLVDRCAAAGFTPAVRHTTDDYVVVQNLVAAGLGVALLPGFAVEAYRHPAVVLRDSAELGTRFVGVLHADGAQTVPAVAALLRELRRGTTSPSEG
jgi:DNA-binding transcriptional LysR family regulator